jgi:ABC-type Fe3+/spermidine/putrescine transport system ATPase subunit
MDHDIITIELRGDVTVEAKNHQAKTGKKVVLAVRPETLDIVAGSEKDGNSISGVIERVTFEGTDVRYEIRLENQDLMVVVKPSMTEVWFSLGEKVTVRFPMEKVHIFSYPETGLKEETAVE